MIPFDDGILRWPHQSYGVAEVIRRFNAGVRKLVLTSPTGGGKSLMQCDLIRYGCEFGTGAILYTNRRLLLQQWIDNVLVPAGIDYGVRAAGVEPRFEKPVQVCSIQTERERSMVRKTWSLPNRTLVIVDEAHLMNNPTAHAILNEHAKHGSLICGVTATPMDMGDFYEDLVVAGTPSELRRCGALVYCRHMAGDEIDMRGFTPSVKTGEYKEADLHKQIVRPQVFGSVLQHYLQFNPNQVPTILFGPDVPGSIWFAEQFRNAGVRSAHIDGKTCWIDGQFYPSTGTEGEQVRADILHQVKAGNIKVLCNRFVCREGIDIPELSYAILATVMGSLQTYLQSCGRILRACKGIGKKFATIQDHGGHWWRFGSVNVDRHWDLNHTETMIAGIREQRFREKKEREPIVCPKCRRVRIDGERCPQCGFVTTKRSRIVIQTDGTLKERVGDIFAPWPVKMEPNTLDLWKQCYFRAKKSKNRMNFRQAQGLFYHEQGYWPPHDLPLMPKNHVDWHRRVCDVPVSDLIS
jgi:DNA repair protein RadD